METHNKALHCHFPMQAERERRAKKKERQKRRKEAERERREAEEAERAQVTRGRGSWGLGGLGERSCTEVMCRPICWLCSLPNGKAGPSEGRSMLALPPPRKQQLNEWPHTCPRCS